LTQSVVDVAEEWINRVKELITEIYNRNSSLSLEAMKTIQEMLGEVDQMPVIMPEAQVLLDILEWVTNITDSGSIVRCEGYSKKDDVDRTESVSMDCERC